MELTELQKKWLVELESGKHKQGKNSLRVDDNYCCLGVAAEFALCITPIKNSPHMDYLFEGYNAYLGYNHVAKLGLRDGHGAIDKHYEFEFHKALNKAGYEGNTELGNLARYNDHGATFAQIAAAIRAVPKAVFY